jgi:carbon monoxide dehydrogenase subunit G
MEMTGQQHIAASRARVWDALNDPEILRGCIPGCQTLEKNGDDSFTATAEIKIGPIGARFKGAVSLTEIEPLQGYTISGQGSGGIAGNAKGSAKVRLSDDGAGTLVSYVVDAEVGGRMAQLGGPIIDATARQLSGKFFARFAELVAETGQAPAEALTAAPSAGSHAPASTALVQTPSPAQGLPMAWILAMVVAALSGYLIGRGQGASGSDWAGLAIGLLVIIVAAAGFEFGKRAAPTITVDVAALRSLLLGAEA